MRAVGALGQPHQAGGVDLPGGDLELSGLGVGVVERDDLGATLGFRAGVLPLHENAVLADGVEAHRPRVAASEDVKEVTSPSERRCPARRTQMIASDPD